MKTVSRKQLREAIKERGANAALLLPRNTLTHKERRFTEALVLESMTGADAYRTAYNTKAKPKQVGSEASRLKAKPRIAAEIAALEQAKELATLHSAEALRSLVISTLTKTIIDEDTKPATRIQAAKILGQVTEVSAFTTRTEVTHIQDSSAIRDQILGQLKTMMLSSDDAVDIDANDLLTELVGPSADPTPPVPPETENGTPATDLHSIPHEQSPDLLEDPPVSLESSTPQGDIFLENEK